MAKGFYDDDDGQNSRLPLHQHYEPHEGYQEDSEYEEEEEEVEEETEIYEDPTPGDIDQMFNPTTVKAADRVIHTSMINS